MAIGSVTNGYLQQSMNAAPVRKLFRKKSPVASRLDELNFRLRNNHVDVDVPPPSISDNIKYQAKEIIGQGIEEYGQSIASTFSKAFGESMLNKYIEDRYKDGKIASALDYDLGTAFSAGAEAAGEALTDRESIQSALYGVLTMGIGRPTFNVVDGKLKIGYENPFINMFKPETNPEYQQKKELAQAVTEYFSNPKKLDSLLSAAANVAHTRDFQEAVAQGDEKAIRDAQNAILLDAAAMVSQMDGTEAGQQILETLQKRAALSTSNLEDPESVENKVLQEFYKNPENKGIKEKDAIKSIVQSAKTTLNLISRSKEIAEEFPSLFGNLEDMDLQNAFVRHVLTLENREQRVKDLEAELKQHTTRVSTRRSKLSTSAKEFLAEFGSAENASKALAKMRKDLVSDIANLKKQGASDKQIAAHRKTAVKEISAIEQRIDNYNSEVENIPEKDRIVTAADILELSPEYRGMFMSTKNRSQEQIARLSEFSNHAKELMVDSGLNYAEAKSLEHAYKMFVSDPNHTARFFNNTKLAALRERASFKYEYLNRENISYEELFDEYNKAMRSASNDIDKEAIFNTMLKTPHARRLLNEVTTANRERTALVGSEVWQSLDDSTKNKLDSVFKYMYDHHIPLDNSLSSDDLIDLVNSIPEEEFNGEMTLDETGKYDLKEVADLVEKLKGLLENRAKEKAEIEASTKEVVAEAPSNPSPSTAPVVVEEATPGPVENPVWELDKPYTLISDPDTTGLSTEVKAFLNEHSQGTITPSTKIGKAVIFYTPTSLLGKGHNGSNPVVALIANEEGSITLGDRSYSALGIVASDTGFTVDRRDTTTGDIHYSDNAQISNVEAGGLTGSKEAKGTPIKDLSPNALNRIHKGKTKKGKPTLEIKVSRGKGKSGEMALTVHTGRITEVEDKDGKTLDVTTKEAFDSLETTTEAERLAFIHANPYTSLLHDILSRSALFDRSNPEKYLEDKFFELFYFSNKAKANKNAFSVTKVKGERASQEVLLNIGSSSFKLTTVTNGEWTARNTIEFLYNAMYSNGTLIKDPSTKQPALLYQVKYDSPTSIRRAFETGILRVYASSLEYQEPKITLRRVKESTVVETKPTDNATPISASSSDTIVTPAGVEVPSDTGVNPQEDTETEGLLVDPNKIDTEDLFEYDLTTATREEKVAWLRDNHKAFLQARWTTTEYENAIKSLKERAKHFTTRNFIAEGKKSLENAKIEAKIAFHEMNAKIKSDMIKSTEIVNIKNGYALKVHYYSLSEYIEAQASYFNKLSNKEINAILSNIKDGTDMLQSERLGSIVEGLTSSALYRDYDAFLNSPINRQLNTLLKNLLESYGFTVISQDLSKVFKNDPLGAMSFAHKLVLLSSTKSTAMTLPEEFSHAMIRLAMLKSDNLYSVLNVNKLLEAIQDTALYKDVYQQYKETYKTVEGEPDIARITEEALGKALATAVSKEYANSQDASFLGKVKNWFNKVLNMFKTLANTVNHNWFKEAMLYNQLSKAAKQLLNTEISTSESLDLNVTSEDIVRSAGITSTDKVEAKENPSREKARKALEAECTAINIPLKYLAPEIREEISKIGITEEQWYKIPRALQETIIKCRVRY